QGGGAAAVRHCRPGGRRAGHGLEAAEPAPPSSTASTAGDEGRGRSVRSGSAQGRARGGHGPPAGWCYERFPVLVHPTQWPRAASTPKMPPSQSVLRPYWVSSRTEPNRSSLGLTYIRALLSGDGLRATGPRSLSHPRQDSTDGTGSATLRFERHLAPPARASRASASRACPGNASTAPCRAAGRSPEQDEPDHRPG